MKVIQLLPLIVTYSAPTLNLAKEILKPDRSKISTIEKFQTFFDQDRKIFFQPVMSHSLP